MLPMKSINELIYSVIHSLISCIIHIFQQRSFKNSVKAQNQTHPVCLFYFTSKQQMTRKPLAQKWEKYETKQNQKPTA